ncbi:hypothetical protein FBEOM_5330 [Fusarium beomiforme]|uniref:Uncharacterized protein n=1 Tax=Fusarium beomiforme TaxID=44412 RepID=A0A9P5ALC7_9HYPO|nr:hypothetical protein FBEOM_5330 [Fusarium beomiforme]
MFPPSHNATDKPMFADWMTGIQSLLPPVDFDHPNDSAEPNRHPDISAIDFSSEDFDFSTELTDDGVSNRLPLLCDDTFDDFFSFDHDANGSDNSYPISPLTELAQSANTATTDMRTDDDQQRSPRSKRSATTAGTQQRDTQDLRCWDHGYARLEPAGGLVMMVPTEWMPYSWEWLYYAASDSLQITSSLYRKYDVNEVAWSFILMDLILELIHAYCVPLRAAWDNPADSADPDPDPDPVSRTQGCIETPTSTPIT